MASLSSETSAPSVTNVLVLGGGSAGFLAALTLKVRLPNLNVTLLHSSAIPILGVGEGTTLTMPIYLHGYLGIPPAALHQAVHPTYKLGIHFLWGPRERFHYTFTNQLDAILSGLPKPNGFYAFEDFEFADPIGALMSQGKAFEVQANGAPIVPLSVGYHLENQSFVRFLVDCAVQSGVTILDDTVREVKQDKNGVKELRLESGRAVSADLFVDCSGFRSELLGKALKEPFESFSSSLFNDRAVTGAWERQEEPILPYTTAETMDAGWCWRIEHERLVNRGYVYSSKFISDSQAEEEFRRKNPKIKDAHTIKFVTGAYRRHWVKNVVALGNASGFVEPLESTSLAVICEHAAKLVHCLAEANFTIDPTSQAYYNHFCTRTWNCVRRFLAIHFRFNSRLDTKYWRACRQEADLAEAAELVEYYQTRGPATLWSQQVIGPDDPFGWEGYLVLLLGQKVPFLRAYEISEGEKKAWQIYQAELRRRALTAISMEDGLAVLHSPGWKWRPDFYAAAKRW